MGFIYFPDFSFIYFFFSHLGLKLADRPERLVNENFGSILTDYKTKAASSDSNFDLEDEYDDFLSGCNFHRN